MYFLGIVFGRSSDGLKILLDISLRPNIVPFLGNYGYAALTYLPWFMDSWWRRTRSQIYSRDKLIGIGCGCVSGGPLGCLCLDTLEESHVWIQ